MKRSAWKVMIVVAVVLTLGAMGGYDAAAQLPPDVNADGDGFYNQLEKTLGANPNDPQSTPESHAVAGSCTNFEDDDRDGLIDAADPGCTMEKLTLDLKPGLDIFRSTARFDQGSLGGGFPPEPLELKGPTVITREGRGSPLTVTIVAQQLNGQLSDGRSVVGIVVRPSAGRVESGTDAPPFSSFFEVNAAWYVDGEKVAEGTQRVENPNLERLPPVQDARKIDPEKCYQFPGGLHCPEVPHLEIPVLKYVAKFDCGVQPSTPPPFLGPVKPGNYATKIVIHNPHGVPVNVEKKAAIGLKNPLRNEKVPRFAEPSLFQSVTLPPDAVIDVDCPDILFNLYEASPPEAGEAIAFVNGVVVILSEKKLDVIANYTYELAKEKIEFMIYPPKNAPPAMRALARKRLKLVTFVLQRVIIDEEEEVRNALKKQFPPNIVDRTKIRILGDDVGVGSSIDIEAIRPQKCLLVDPPHLPEGQLECEAEDM